MAFPMPAEQLDWKEKIQIGAILNSRCSQNPDSPFATLPDIIPLIQLWPDKEIKQANQLISEIKEEPRRGSTSELPTLEMPSGAHF